MSKPHYYAVARGALEPEWSLLGPHGGDYREVCRQAHLSLAGESGHEGWEFQVVAKHRLHSLGFNPKQVELWLLAEELATKENEVGRGY